MSSRSSHPSNEPSPTGPDGALNPRARVPRRPAILPAAEYVDGILAGDRALLSRAITLVESTRPDHQHTAQEVLHACLPHAGRSVRLGITGVPGVGKSTFIDVFGLHVLDAGHRVAVLAIDPTSGVSRGSILGDKTRMERLGVHADAFIRPSPAGGSLGGVARRTREVMLLCEAAGFDVVFVETVGVGQSETVVHSMVDFFLLLALAGAGDELQGIKRGIVEMADALVITKADGANRERALRARAEYRNALSLFPPPPSGWRPRVLTASALTGDGIAETWAMVRTYLGETRQSGFFERRRTEQRRHWLYQTVDEMLLDRFRAHAGVRALLPEMERAVLDETLTPAAAAARLLACYGGDPPVETVRQHGLEE